MAVGSTYGKYFLLKKLAAGGMGEVYLARQQGPAGFEKILVIKRILEHLSVNEKYARAFLSEAKIQAQMNHSSIVQIFDLGQAEDGTYYMAMEFVPGKSLIDLLMRTQQRRQAMPPVLTAEILERAAEALSYAHNMTDAKGQSLNIIHRDVSPHNVLISYHGDVKLIDFGIAKSEMSVVKTETGTIKGKFFYMSPEQSSAMKLDKRSDIFSLGIVLYESLVGENPFQRPNVVQALEAIQQFEPPPPSEVNPELAPFDPIVAKALAKNRDDRYADAEDMKDDLVRVRYSLPPSKERLGAFVSRMFKREMEEDSKVLQETDGASLGGLPTPEPVRPSRPSKSNVSSRRSRQVPAIKLQTTENKDDFGFSPTLVPQSIPAEHSDTVVRAPAYVDADVDPDPAEQPADEAAITLPPDREVADTGEDSAVGEETPLSEGPLGTDSGQFGPGATDPLGNDAFGSSQLQGGRVAIIAAAVVVLGGGGGLIAWSVTHPKSQALPALPETPPGETRPPEQPLPPTKSRVTEPVVTGDGQTRETPPPQRSPEVRTPDRSPTEPRTKDPGEGARKPTESKKPTGELRRKTESEKKSEPAKKLIAAAAAPSGPKLLLRTVPALPMASDGKPTSGVEFVLTGGRAVVDVGDATSPLRIKVACRENSGSPLIDVNSDPWAIVYVNGVSQGKTPQFGLKIGSEVTRVELRNPSVDSAVVLLVRYQPK